MGPRPTSNQLNQQWLFVNKNPESEHLTRSSGAEKTKVYGHVRQHMVKDTLIVQEEFQNVFGPGRGPTVRNRKKGNTRPRKTRSTQNQQKDAVDAHSPDDLEGHQVVQVARGRTNESLGLVGSPSAGLNAAPYSRSYEYFRQRTISDATSFADRQFWDASMQLSASNEAIFHALTSLGALHESLMNEASRHEFRQASLSHCNHAIRTTIQQQMSLPMVLVTCVIFTTIQIFEDAPMAQKTLESGIKLVTLAELQASRLSNSEQSMVDLVTRMLERYQSRLTLLLLPTTVVQDHLGHVGTDSDMPRVPAIFDSLLQAREILQAICDWSFHVAKSARTLVLTDGLQKQWIQAIIQLSESTDLHPLSMRSVNLLKIARLASACLIAAQFLTRKIEIDEYFPTFLRLLEQYADSFRLCKSNAIFTTVFHIDAGIVDILQQLVTAEIDHTLRTQAQDALCSEPAPDQRQSPADTTLDSRAAGNFRIQSLDFFAQTGLARLRLRRNDTSFSTPTPEVRWFSLLDTTANPGIPEADGSEPVQWKQDLALRTEG